MKKCTRSKKQSKKQGKKELGFANIASKYLTLYFTSRCRGHRFYYFSKTAKLSGRRDHNSFFTSEQRSFFKRWEDPSRIYKMFKWRLPSSNIICPFSNGRKETKFVTYNHRSIGLWANVSGDVAKLNNFTLSDTFWYPKRVKT